METEEEIQNVNVHHGHNIRRTRIERKHQAGRIGSTRKHDTTECIQIREDAGD